MGASTSWLAFKGKPRTKILEELSLCIGEASGHGAMGADFPAGWYVIAAADYGHPLTEDESLRRLSIGCEVIAGGVETHVMCSTACGWKDGREIWWMDHDSEAEGKNLSTRGQLPSVFDGIYKELQAQQDAEDEEAGENEAGVDYIFDAPVNLTKALTGYHYEEPDFEPKWHTLVPAPQKKSWLSGLFKG